MKKEQIYAVQGTLSLGVAWISAKLGILFPMLIIFIGMMVIDQISGMSASKREALDRPGDPNYGWSSTKWRKGIYKKFGYILTVMIGMVTDYVIFMIAKDVFNTEIPVKTMFGLLIIVWFILNEALSILENAGRMGANYPEFIWNVLSVMRAKVEDKGNVLQKEDEEDEEKRNRSERL